MGQFESLIKFVSCGMWNISAAFNRRQRLPTSFNSDKVSQVPICNIFVEQIQHNQTILNWLFLLFCFLWQPTCPLDAFLPNPSVGICHISDTPPQFSRSRIWKPDWPARKFGRSLFLWHVLHRCGAFYPNNCRGHSAQSWPNILTTTSHCLAHFSVVHYTW